MCTFFTKKKENTKQNKANKFLASQMMCARKENAKKSKHPPKNYIHKNKNKPSSFFPLLSHKS